MHRHPVNRIHLDLASVGQKSADTVAQLSGSWRMIGIHLVWWGVWLGLGLAIGIPEAPPFALLTMVLSLESALLMFIIMISQNRSAERDRLVLEHESGEMEVLQTLLQENTTLTRQVKDLTTQVHDLLSKK